MSTSAVEGPLQLGARCRQMADSQFDTGRDKIELKPVELICTPRGRRLACLLLFGRFNELTLAQQPLNQGDAGGQFIVGLTVLMKLFFALADHSFSIGGMTLLNREPRQGELRFRDGLFFSSFFAQRQRFFVDLRAAAKSPRSASTSPTPESAYAMARLSSISLAIALAP